MANEVSRECTSIDWSFATTQSHLPPKIPLFSGGGSAIPESSNSFFSNWPNFPYPSGNRKQHQRTPSASFLPQTLPWIDDLLNDNSDVPPRKNTHRRSSSDSLTFLEVPLQHARFGNIAEEEEFDCGSMVSRPSRRSKDLDKLDEEQLTSMFADIGPFQKQPNPYVHVDLHTSAAEKRASAIEAPSTPSDHDSGNEHSLDDGRTEAVGHLKDESDVQSGHNAEHMSLLTKKEEPLPVPNATDSSLEPKRAKRILANRQSAQRSRVRKLQYIAELEMIVNALQAEVSTLSPQVAFLDHHRVVLNIDNSVLKQRLAASTQEKLFKDAHNEALKKQVCRLRQLFQQQMQQQVHETLPHDIRHRQFVTHSLPVSLQTNLREADVSSGVANSLTAVFNESEAESIKKNALSKAALTKTIGPSSCSTDEKGSSLQCQMVSGIPRIHSDFRVYSP